MVSSQKPWPLDHEAGRINNVKRVKVWAVNGTAKHTRKVSAGFTKAGVYWSTTFSSFNERNFLLLHDVLLAIKQTN